MKRDWEGAFRATPPRATPEQIAFVEDRQAYEEFWHYTGEWNTLKVIAMCQQVDYTVFSEWYDTLAAITTLAVAEVGERGA